MYPCLSSAPLKQLVEMQAKVFQMSDSPGHVFVAHVQKYEKALIIRCVCFVSPQHGSNLLESHQIDYVNVDFLRDGRWIQRVINDVVFRPRSAVHVEVPGKFPYERESIATETVKRTDGPD